MTATVTVTDNTVKVDDLIFKLDSLVTAYDEVLSMAKQQLEQFSVSDDDWARIYERLSRRIDYYDLGNSLKRSLLAGLIWMEDNPDSANDSSSDCDVSFTRALISRLRRELEAAVRDHIVSEAIRCEIACIRNDLRNELRDFARNAAGEAVGALVRDQTRTAERQRELVRELLESTFGNELKTMIREASSQT